MCCLTVSYFPLRLVKFFIGLFSLGLVVRTTLILMYLQACGVFTMYQATKSRRMNIWLAYGAYLPQNLSDYTFYLGIFLGGMLIFLFFLGFILITRAKHCIVTCSVSKLFERCNRYIVQLDDIFSICNILPARGTVPGCRVLWIRSYR